MAQRYLTALLLSFLFYSSGFAQGFGNLEFVRNDGQWNHPFQYKASGAAGDVYIEPTGFLYVVSAVDNVEKIHAVKHNEVSGPAVLNFHAYRVVLEGARLDKAIESKIQSQYYNYFLGNDPAHWKSNIHPAHALDYEEVYPGTQLHLASQGGNLKYEFILEAGADASLIKMKYEFTNGLAVKDGKLLISTGAGTVQEMEPYAYQSGPKGRVEVSCRYKLKGNTVQFSFPKGYDETLPLVIDPVVVFATFTGSMVDNWGFTATYDLQGNLYAGGIANGAGYPFTTGFFQATFGGGDGAGSGYNSDITISKFNATGTNMVYSTYLGGSSNEQPHSLIVDPSGNLLIAGRTYSINYPVTAGSYDVSQNGGADIVVTKLNPGGTALIGSTYIGGSGDDGVNVTASFSTQGLKYNYGDDARSEVICDKQGNAYVAASSQSTNFPTLFPTQPLNNGSQDGVIFKLNNNLSSLLWSTYLGGSANDAAYVLALDTAEKHLYVAGGTSSPNFPSTAGTLNPSYQGGMADGFIVKFANSAGFALQRSTFIGRNDYDQCYGIQVDLENKVYAMGQTLGGTFPVTSGVYSNPNSSQFIIKLDTMLSTNIYSTVFGSGNSTEINISPVAFLVDTCQNVYISGWGGGLARPLSTTTGMPVTAATAIQPTTDGNDFYYFVLSKNAVSLLYATFHGANQGTNGGEHVDGGTSRFDKNGVIYQAICGACGSGNTFPTTPGVWAPTKPVNINCNLTAVKIAFQLGSVLAEANANPNTKGCPPFTVNFLNTSSNATQYTWNFGDGSPTSNQVAPTHTFVNVGVYNVRMVAFNPNACREYDTAYLVITVDTNRVVANFNAMVTDSCGPYRVAVTNTSLYGYLPGAPGFTTFQWNWGDGTTSAGPNPGFHNYPDTGTYTIRLTMRDTTACNNPDTFSRTIRIHSVRVKAAIAMPDSVCIGTNTPFTNGSSNATFQTWTFGDGGSSTAKSPTHTYASPGFYDIVLISGNPNSCNKLDTAKKRIYIRARPTAAFTHAPVVPITNQPVDFTNTSTNATSYKWDFGDNNTSTQTSPRHLYKRTGKWTVCLIAKSTEGCADTVCHPVETDIRPLVDLPTAFSPNGDGVNDILYVKGGAIESMHLLIFNRFGQMVFESNTLERGWDGRFNGKEMEIEVYAFILEATFIDGTKAMKKGNITLLR